MHCNAIYQTLHSSWLVSWGHPNVRPSQQLFPPWFIVHSIILILKIQNLRLHNHVFIYPQSRHISSCTANRSVRVCSWKPHQTILFFLLPLPFPSPPTLNVHSQDYPRVFVRDVGHADSRDDFQQVGGNSSIKSGHALLGHDVVNQGQHGRLRGSLHWSWVERKEMNSGKSCYPSDSLSYYLIVTGGFAFFLAQYLVNNLAFDVLYLWE